MTDARAPRSRRGRDRLVLEAGLRPEELAPFIGRAGEAAVVAGLIRDHRLVTLIGPGGSGKTRLALHVLRGAVPDYGGGTAFVDLSAVEEVAEVPGVIAATVLGRVASTPPIERLRLRIADRSTLFVLDNLEQIDGVGTVVVELLTSIPSLTILATSRTALRVSGERLIRVDPLGLPSERATAFDEVGASDAVEFFLDRVSAAAPGFGLTAENAGDVAAICRRLDGLPLALELAAPWVASLGVGEVRREVEAGTELAAPAHDAPARHRTLRATLEWSTSRLSPEARTLLADLAVFRSPVDLEDVEAMSSDYGAVARLLAELVDANLVLVTSTAGRPSYRLLQVIRELGRDKLQEAGRLDDVRYRHATHLVDVASRASIGLGGHEQATWYDRLGRMNADIEAAIEWSIERGDAAVAQALTGPLLGFWMMSGRVARGHRLALAALEVIGDVPPVVRIRALTTASRLAFDLEGSTQAAALAREALRGARFVGDQQGEARALTLLALSDVVEGRTADGVAGLRRALPLAHATGDPETEISVLGNLAVVEGWTKDVAAAEAALQEVVAAARRVGDAHSEGRALGNLGIVLEDRGSRHLAVERMTEAVERLRPFGATADLSWVLLSRSFTLARLELTDEARRDLDEGIPLALDSGDPFELVIGVRALFELELARGRPRSAERLWPTLVRGWRHNELDTSLRPNVMRDAARRLTSRLGHGSVRRRLAEGTEPIALSELARAVEAGFTALDEIGDTDGAPAPSSHRPRGRFDLTSRELQVLLELVGGRSDAEIADRLGMTRKTASVHVSNIKGKLGVDSRTAAVVEAMRLGLVEPGRQLAGQSRTDMDPEQRPGASPGRRT